MIFVVFNRAFLLHGGLQNLLDGRSGAVFGIAGCGAAKNTTSAHLQRVTVAGAPWCSIWFVLVEEAIAQAMSSDPQFLKFRAAATEGNPAAQFNLGLWLMRQPGAGPFPAEAQDWLRQSANAGFAPAQTMLGRMHLGYPGGARDVQKAQAWFAKAAEQAFPEACYQLAELAVAQGATPKLYAQARDWLQKAARLDHPLAWCQLGYLLEQGIGGAADPVEAIACYRQAARAGVPRAWNQLASYFASGHGVARHAGMARAAYQRAAAKDYPGAAAAAEALSEDRSGDELAADSYTDQQLLGVPVTPKACQARPECRPEVLSEDPRIAVLRNLFIPTECQHLIAVAAPHLGPSQVVSADGENVSHAMRTSWEMRFEPETKDMLVWIYERRLARLSNTRPEQGEPLLILRYEPGQEYQTHVDYFDPALPGQKKVIDETGQRSLTLLTYLSDVEAGGGTAFPKLDIQVDPEPGMTLAFYNVTGDGRPDPRTKHAGLPVERGTKWLATRWVRDRDWQGGRS